jgi:SET and MYND domain-containing protein
MADASLTTMQEDTAVATDVPGKGRGLKAARNIRSGEVILSELPILLVASDLEGSCSACLRTLPAATAGELVVK